MFALCRLVGRVWAGCVAGVVVGALVLGGVVSAGFAQGGGEAAVGSQGAGSSVGVDERTGRASTGVTVGVLPGLAGDGAVSVGLSWSQERMGVDASGVGPGWGFTVDRVDVSEGTPRVFPASGGVYDADASVASGLARYPGADLVFRQKSGELGVSGGVVSYGFVLETAQGVEYFSGAGFLVARMDVFGNVTRWVWDETTGRLLSVIDRAGNRLTFVWSDAGFTVQAPSRGDGVTPNPVVVETDARGVKTVTDVEGEVTGFSYNQNGLLDEVVSSRGTSTRVSYQPVGDVVGVDEVTVFDETGGLVSRRSWSPVGVNVFTGYPKTLSGEAVLWGSGDGEFRYVTRVSDGATSTVSTFNALGLLIDRSVIVTTVSGEETVRSDVFTYRGTQAGGVPAPGEVSAFYGKPLEVASVFRDGERSRTVREASEYDDRGRVVRHADVTGAVTTTRYDDTPVGVVGLPASLVVEQVVTGTDGLVSKTVGTPSVDHRTIAVSEMFTGSVGGELVSVARSSVETAPDGFVLEKTVSTSPIAGSGPGSVSTRFSRVVDENSVMLIETSAIGTSAEGSTSVVVDVASGLPVSSTDALGLVTETGYDQAGRPTEVTDPAGRVTRTESTDHGRVSRVTGPDGVTTSTYRDVLGNIVRVANNIVEGRDGVPIIVPEVERTVETRAYENNHARVTVMDALGRTSVGESDVFGRQRVASIENGLSRVWVYDDVANTVTTGVTATPAKGLSGALRTTTTRLDDAGREVGAVGVRADGVRVSESKRVFDGLGRTVSSMAGDVSSSVAFNAAGLPETSTAVPVNPTEFPGDTVTARRTFDARGAVTNKTLTRGDGVVDSLDRATGVSRVVDAAGRTVSVTDQVGG